MALSDALTVGGDREISSAPQSREQRRVLFCAASVPAYVDLAVAMQRTAGWQPCYWIGRAGMSHLVAAAFPGTVFHDHHQAIWGRMASECASLETDPLSPEILSRLSECESMALRMMDRIDYADLLGLEERRQLYLQHVRHWSAVLDKFRPDILFNTATPHQIYDFVLYELCRMRGIQTIMIGLCFDLNRVFCKSGYVDSSGLVAAAYRRRRSEVDAWDGTLAPEMDEYISRMQQRYDHAMPWYIEVLIKDEAKQPAALTPGKVLRAAARAAYHGSRAVFSAFSGRVASWKVAATGWRDFRRWLYQEITGPLRVRYLRKYYEQLCGPVDFTRPFVYFPLHYQPEMTTVPEGGYFSDQCLAVETLSKAAPEGWIIYVKEHPIQMTYAYGTNHAARSFGFYDRLIALRNVRLAPLDVSPFALIDRAHVVATVTGTSGWEALVRGKPVFHFGHPWWKGCAGAFPISGQSDCRNAFETVEAGFRVDSRLVRLFAHVLQDESCGGDLYRERELQKLTAAESPRLAGLVQNMAHVVHQFERRTAGQGG